MFSFMSRTAIFIDGGYLDFVGKEVGIHFDLEKLPEELAKGAEILRTYYYNCLPYQSDPPSQEEAERFSRSQKFYSKLSKFNRFEVKLGTLVPRGVDKEGKTIFVQKKVDILLGVDLAILSGKQQINEAIIVAGDSDFIPAVEAAKDQGVLVRLYHGTTVHTQLWEAVDERILMDKKFANKVRFVKK